MKTLATAILALSLFGSYVAFATSASAGSCTTTCQRYGSTSNCTTHCY